MTFLKSKLGLALMVAYLLIVAGTWLYSFFCKQAFCELIVALPVLPFVAFFDEFFKVNAFTYVLSVLMGSGVVYFLGAGMAWIGSKI